MVVAVAMIGSVTVVPGDARLARRPGRQGPRAVPARRRQAADGESRVWNCVLTASSAPGCCRPSPRRGRAVALAHPGARHAHGATGTDDLPRNLAVMKVYDRCRPPSRAAQIPAVVAIEAKRRDDAADRRPRVKQLEATALATGTMNGPSDVDGQPGQARRARRDPDQGQRHRRRLQPTRSPTCATRSSTSTVGHGAGRRAAPT